ncbi:MAG: ribosomal RNA small subunit methyltransferase A [Candidatus Yonathbacteria bacterium]|nr:ribosomal RNA small subunit methyltransferase A [Candidatus Yonathbacteria bacterium]
MANIHAKKSLGQNFLTSDKAIADIAAAARAEVGDTILEIGPGTGALTRALLATGAHVVAVEKDDRLIPELRTTFADEIAAGRLDLVHGDALELDLSAHGLVPGAYILAANIPYYITGLIIRKFFSRAHLPKRAVLLVQKEVAERITAKEGKGSIVSIAIRAYGTPEIVRQVPRGMFTPSPSVDSAVLLVANIADPFSSENEELFFFDTLRKGFSHKRKLLASNLDCGQDILKACTIDTKARAEDLSAADWHSLCAHLLEQPS